MTHLNHETEYPYSDLHEVKHDYYPRWHSVAHVIECIVLAILLALTIWAGPANAEEVISSPEYIGIGVADWVACGGRMLVRDAVGEVIRETELQIALETYIASVNKRADKRAVAEELLTAAKAHDIDPWLLAAIARYESGFRTNARGSAGERGLLQIHPVHKLRGAAPTTYGAGMIRRRLNEGLSLYASPRPWTVRRKAWREYQKIKEGIE